MTDNPHSDIPRHVAVIMDGNGRWAAARSLPRIRGHEAGAESVRACVEACGNAGVRFLTMYAFSSENWKRPTTETGALMLLLERFLKQKRAEMIKRNIRFEAIGRLEGLPKGCRRELEKTREATAHCEQLTLIFALNYGGRQELVDAMQAIAADAASGAIRPEDIGEETISKHLYTKNWPDPDLLIRTSGELRISNFLLWQLSYTELYITPTLWPDFREPHLMEAFAEYKRRHRRYGAI